MNRNRFYHTFCVIFDPLFHVFFPFRAHGLEHLPKDRPFILCPNHANAMDPFLVCLSMPHSVPIRIMAKKELMDKPLLGRFLGALGAFGVDRGHSDIAALRTAIKALRDGDNLLVFPEGTRVKYPGEMRAKGGVAMIALRTGAALVPVYAGKRNKLFRRTDIVFGEPYEPETATRHGTAEEYQAFADEVLRRAYALGGECEA